MSFVNKLPPEETILILGAALFVITMLALQSSAISASNSQHGQYTIIPCTCSDPDGKNYYYKGYTSYFCSGKNFSKWDACNSTTRLTEYYCYYNNIKSELYTCPYGCKNGACLKGTNQTCSSGSECASGNCVKDIDSSAYGCCPADQCWYKTGGYCLANGYRTNTPRNGIYYVCYHGNWVKAPLTNCSDSDGGKNYNVFGRVIGFSASGQSIDGSDYCVADNITLYEQYCDGVFASNITQKYVCPYKCSNGACLKGNGDPCSTATQCQSNNCARDMISRNKVCCPANSCWFSGSGICENNGTTYTTPWGAPKSTVNSICRNGNWIIGTNISYSCVKLLENLPKENKINFVVISSEYNSSTRRIFENESKKLLGLVDAKYYVGLMKLKPFSNNWENINIYLLESDENFTPPLFGADSDYSLLGQLCGVMPDFIFVIVHNNIFYSEFIGGNHAVVQDQYPDWSEQNRNCDVNGTWICDNPPVYYDSGLWHEFGHIFGDLRDEYVYLWYDTRSLGSNRDYEFCPKWCSGKPNTNISCYPRYKEITDCFKTKGRNITNQEIFACLGNDYDSFFGCNVGKDCRPGTGCYPGAFSINLYRPYTNYMMGDAPHTYAYGIIGEEAFQQVIDSRIASQ